MAFSRQTLGMSVLMSTVGYASYKYVGSNVERYIDGKISQMFQTRVEKNCGNADETTKQHEVLQKVYRGDRSSNSPDKVFVEGLKPKGTSDNLLDHVTNREPGNYISTSKSFDIAKEFAGKNGYIYDIEAAGGIDVNLTLGENSPYPEQGEVSFPGGIPPSEIRGAWPVNKFEVGEYIENQNYGGKQ